jgi:hypothetical protein
MRLYLPIRWAFNRVGKCCGRQRHGRHSRQDSGFHVNPPFHLKYRFDTYYFDLA